jgi:hypothetical protein
MGRRKRLITPVNAAPLSILESQNYFVFFNGTAYVVDRGLGLGDERDDGVVDHDLALAPAEVGQSVLGRVHIAPEVDVLYTASTRAQELQILNSECVGRRKDAAFLLLLNLNA